MDPLMLLFLLIAGLTGADSVSSVSWVTVQSGGSVTIPCLYEDGDKNHVKYWCKGDDWQSCTVIVRTDSPQTKGDVSIRDDPEQRVFTVTMNNLKIEDADYYWCLVEISGHSDDGDWLTLSVTDGSPGLSVDKQEVTGVEGDSVSVQCRYGDRSSEMNWCKIGDFCVSGNSGSLDGRPVEIRDDRGNKVFSVTMRGLERKDTGWYWCDDGYLQIPVHITVNLTTTAITEGADSVSSVRRVTVQSGGSVTIPCLYEDKYKRYVKYWCRGSDWWSCAPIVRTDSPQTKGDVSIRDDPDQRLFTLTMNNLTTGDADIYWCCVQISRHSNVCVSVELSVTDDHVTVSLTATTTTKETIKASAAGFTTKMLLQTVSVHDGGNNERGRWEQVLGAVLKAGTGVFYLICTIIAIQLHWSSCRKRGSNQREEEGEANTNHGS